jgi:hypothetical protein
MGLFGSAGLKSAFSTASLIGQDIVARSISLTQATGLVALQMVNGARLAIGSGLTYLSSDGTSVSFASPVVLNGQATTTNIVDNGNFWAKAGYYNGASSAALMISQTAPTISSGFGTTPSIVASNGSFAFTLNVGTGGVATTGVIGLPAATTGWALSIMNLSANTATVFLTKQTATTTTTATIGNYDAAGAPAAWTASNILSIIAVAY